MTNLLSGSNQLLAIHEWLDVDNLGSDKGVLHSSQSKQSIYDEEGVSDEDDEVSTCANWEIVGEDLLIDIPEKHKKFLASIFPGVPSSENSDCNNCESCAFCARSMSTDDATLDFYDGRIYCSSCHQDQHAIIPRDIIENWNFTKKPVSFATKSFLDSILTCPMVDLARMNPALFCVAELAEMRRLRRRLALLWSQLTRCCFKASAHLTAALAHRAAYMLTGIDRIDVYSLSDLMDIRSGELEEHLLMVINQFIHGHMDSCQACRIWTSICDICENVSRPIWPYLFINFRRCATPGCHRAMHFDCLLKSKDDKKSITKLFRSINLFDSRSALSSPQSNNQASSIFLSSSPLVPYSTTTEMKLTSDELELLPHCTACRRNMCIEIDCKNPSAVPISFKSTPPNS